MIALLFSIIDIHAYTHNYILLAGKCSTNTLQYYVQEHMHPYVHKCAVCMLFTHMSHTHTGTAVYTACVHGCGPMRGCSFIHLVVLIDECILISLPRMPHHVQGNQSYSPSQGVGTKRPPEFVYIHTKRMTDPQCEPQTDRRRQIDRQTDRDRQTETDRQTDRHTHTHTYVSSTYTCIYIYIYTHTHQVVCVLFVVFALLFELSVHRVVVSILWICEGPKAHAL